MYVVMVPFDEEVDPDTGKRYEDMDDEERNLRVE